MKHKKRFITVHGRGASTDHFKKMVVLKMKIDGIHDLQTILTASLRHSESSC